MDAGWKLAVLIAGCAALAPAASAQELFSAKDAVVENEGKIGDRWMLADGAQLAMPEYPAHLAARGDDVCIALGYQINRDGTTSDFSVIKQWSSAGEQQPVNEYWSAFAQAGADALSQWRFQARPGVAPVLPTYTVATLAFNTGDDGGAGVREHCVVPDLVAAIQARKTDDYARSMQRRDLERLNRAARSNAHMPNPLASGHQR